MVLNMIWGDGKVAGDLEVIILEVIIYYISGYVIDYWQTHFYIYRHARLWCQDPIYQNCALNRMAYLNESRDSTTLYQMSVQTLAEKMAFSPAQVIQVISSMAKLGFISFTVNSVPTTI